VAAAAVFAAAAGSGTPPPRGGGLHALTTAYVVGHTERALAAAEQGGFIYRVSSISPWEYAVATEPMVSGHRSKMRRLDSLKVVRTTTWFYRGQTRVQGFAADGQVAIEIGTSTHSRGPQPPAHIIVVDPNARQWFHPLSYSPRWGPGAAYLREDDWLVGRSAQPSTQPDQKGPVLRPVPG
jgi:hypothetical protein